MPFTKTKPKPKTNTKTKISAVRVSLWDNVSLQNWLFPAVTYRLGATGDVVNHAFGSLQNWLFPAVTYRLGGTGDVVNHVLEACRIGSSLQ